MRRIGAICAAVTGLAVVVACSGDDGAGGNGGTASSSSGESSGASGSSGGGSSSSSGASGGPTSSSGASGAPPATPDDGILPGDSVWRTRTEWYRAIDTAPPAAHSAEMLAALKKWGLNDIFQVDFSFNVLEANGGTPTTFPPNEEGDAVPVPIPAKGYIEGDHPYDGCPDDEDCHMLLIDRPSNRLYELYQAHKSGATWSGYVALWKLDKAYPRSNRGQGCTSADAVGMAITPGLIGYRETKKGAIRHALRFIIRNDYIRGVVGDRNTPNVVYPASHGSTAGAAATGLPYGARLRLKVSPTDPRFKTPGAKAVATALHTYGMILADGGNIPLVAESAKVHADANAAETWEGLLGPKDLGFLRPDDFEVIAIPKGDPSMPDAGWYASKADYNAQLMKPLGCKGIVQP